MGDGREWSFASRGWGTVAVQDGGDHGDDPSTDGFGKLWPSVDHELHIEWGLCGGSRMAGVGAELSGRLPGGKGPIGYNFFRMAGIRWAMTRRRLTLAGSRNYCSCNWFRVRPPPASTILSLCSILC